MWSASLHAWQKPELVHDVQSPESLEEMHMGRDIRQMPMASSRSMPNEFFLDQACMLPTSNCLLRCCFAIAAGTPRACLIVSLAMCAHV